jgi:hypothetical protein
MARVVGVLQEFKYKQRSGVDLIPSWILLMAW